MEPSQPTVAATLGVLVHTPRSARVPFFFPVLLCKDVVWARGLGWVCWGVVLFWDFFFCSRIRKGVEGRYAVAQAWVGESRVYVSAGGDVILKREGGAEGLQVMSCR